MTTLASLDSYMIPDVIAYWPAEDLDRLPEDLEWYREEQSRDLDAYYEQIERREEPRAEPEPSPSPTLVAEPAPPTTVSEPATQPPEPEAAPDPASVAEAAQEVLAEAPPASPVVEPAQAAPTPVVAEVVAREVEARPPALEPAPLSPATVTSPRRRPAFCEAQMRRFLRHLLDPAVGVLEFRVLGAVVTPANRLEPGVRFSSVYAGWYDDVDRLVYDAAKLRGVSGYICLNPALREVRARSHNQVRRAKTTTSDAEVACLRWLFVDVDSVRPAGVSATAAQRAAAHDRARRILAEHPDLAAASLWGSSGNGAYILCRLPDLPNDEEHRRLVAEAVGSLSARYSDAAAKVDPPAKNAARIGPLVGTLKCKGTHIPGDTEWTLVTLEGVGGLPLPERPEDEPALVPVDLAAWLAANPRPEPPPRGGRPSGGAVPGPARDDSTEAVLARARAYVDRMDTAVSGQGGHSQTFDVACALVKGFDLPPTLARPILEAYSARCQPPWSPEELEHKLAQADAKADAKADERPRGYLRDAPRPGNTPPGGGGGGGGDESGEGGFSFSDLGNARRFLAWHRERIRFCKPYGDWLTYDGVRWRRDETMGVDRLAQVIPALVLPEIPAGANPQTVAAHRVWSLRSESAERLRAAVTLARPDVAVTPDDLDADPWLLNVRNGTLDLETGGFKPHDPADLITRLAPVDYDPEATCPRYDRFLQEVTGGRPDIAAFINRFMGFCLTGQTTDHTIPINIGEGGNDKNKFIVTCLGD